MDIIKKGIDTQERREREIEKQIGIKSLLIYT